MPENLPPSMSHPPQRSVTANAGVTTTKGADAHTHDSVCPNYIEGAGKSISVPDHPNKKIK